MKRTMKRLALMLALCLLLACVPTAMAEDALLAAPVDAAIEEAEGADLWTEETAAAEAPAEVDMTAANGLNVGINSNNFPDIAFLLYVQEAFDHNNDMSLSDDERNAAVIMAVYNKGIGSLKGIEYFPKLQELYCGSNQLTRLDLSGKAELKKVWCMDNQLESLDVSGCAALEELSCYNNPLTGLDVSGCAALTSLNSYNCRLASLNTAGCAALEFLDCSGNQLLNLDAADCAALESLYCRNNQLLTLNAAGCENLKSLDCGSNQLTSLNIAGCAALSYLSCGGNRLASLDVTGCTNLITYITQGEGEAVGDAYCFSYGADDDKTRIWIDRATEITADGQRLYPIIPIADCGIAGISAQTYTGRAVEPEPVVTYDGQTLEKGADYEVTYRNNKAVGRATVVIKGINNYTGTVKKAFRINPKKVALTKLTAGKGRLTVRWKRGKGGAGYQIQYSTKKNFSSKKTVTIPRNATVKKVLKNLKSGKVYYVRIRGYKKVGGKAYVSKWSKALKKQVG